MSASKMFKTLCANLLKSSRKVSNFAQQANAEREAYKNLVRQQSVLLDEYEDLLKAYEKNDEGADSTAPSDTSKPSSTDSIPSKENA